MAAQRGEVREGRLECQGAGVLQQGKPRQARPEGPTARGRLPARLFLREDVWDEEKTDEREDGQRPEIADQQEPAGVELLI